MKGLEEDAGRWISVDDQFPNEGRILVFTDKRNVYDAINRNGKIDINYFVVGSTEGATHWQPLPEPPTV